jgi:predicted nicotinamide N-methyase
MTALGLEERALGALLAPQSPPLLPELALWLVAEHVDLNARCEELIAGGYAPYWAFCWGSGQALARFVLDRPELVAGKRVVDFGAGSGVCAIAAALAGAASAVAVDLDSKALAFADRNAALSGVRIEVAAEVPARWDVLLASDVLYDETATRWLGQAAAGGRAVFVSDPHRHGTRRLALAPLAEVEATTFPDVDYPLRHAFVYKLPQAPEKVPG